MATTYTAKGDEQGNPKQIYSSDEVLTGGVWIDGSPIYRIIFSQSYANQNDGVDLTDLNIKTVVSMNTIFNTNNDSSIDNVSEMLTNTTFVTRKFSLGKDGGFFGSFSVNSRNLTTNIVTNLTNGLCTLILEYTKTP